jgi:hypothetical protein
MQSIFSKTLLAFCSFSVIFNFLPAASFEEQKKTQMIQDLEVIKHHFEVGYAPAKWKKEYAGWDLEEAFKHAKNEILAIPRITTKQFQLIVRDFIHTMKDYHVDVLFFSTEASTLPFTVKGAEGRYFIDWIDPLRLPPSHYSIQLGDELLEFDERPIADVMAELIKENSKSANLSTDLALTEMNLTKRSGTAGDRVPQGQIIIKTRSAVSGKMSTYQLCWSYTPENVKSSLDFLPMLDFISGWLPNSKIKTKIQLPQIKMANPLHEKYAHKMADRNGGLGSRKSFIPMLGEPLWIRDYDIDDEEGVLDMSINWYAYIYHHPEGQVIGYIRIPHYVGSVIQAKKFGEIINFMEENTDALVIDQVHNFGGYVHFQYELASMLAIEPLKTPHHRIKITQKEVLEAYKTLEFIKLIELILQSEGLAGTSSDEDDTNEEDHEDDEYKSNEEEGHLLFNYQEIMFVKAYYELILDEWSKGHTLTRPTPILGVDRINPHPKYQYTKPILMLIDEMDFSGGDFMPAILQDNQRAVLFGKRTAGAGGFVFAFEFPNSHGIALCSYTASIAERPNLQKIENLGVTPDIDYQITVDDLQGEYRGYVDAVNQAVQALFQDTQR